MGSYTFKWLRPASEVYVTGTFDDWGVTAKLEKVEAGHFEKKVDLPITDEPILYKFVVDGNWRTDPTADRHIDPTDLMNNILFPRNITPSTMPRGSSSTLPGLLREDAVPRGTILTNRDRTVKICPLSESGAASRNSTRLTVSSLRLESKVCERCNILQQALDRCDGILGTIKDVEVVLPNSTQSFSRCRIYLEQSEVSYELIFGNCSPKRLHEPRWLTDWPFGRVSEVHPKYPVGAIKEWVQRCSETHPLCLRSNTASLPRRVIDVGHMEAFLYESRGEIQPYATLSHCWDHSQPLKTLKANLNRH